MGKFRKKPIVTTPTTKAPGLYGLKASPVNQIFLKEHTRR